MALNEILVVIMFFTFISLLFSGFPIAWVLAGTSVLFTAIGAGLECFGVSLGGFYEVNFTVFKATVNRDLRFFILKGCVRLKYPL